MQINSVILTPPPRTKTTLSGTINCILYKVIYSVRVALRGCSKTVVCYQELPLITDGIRIYFTASGCTPSPDKRLCHCHGAKVLLAADLCLVPMLISVQLLNHGLIKHSCVTVLFLFVLTPLTVLHFVSVCFI